MNKIILLAFLTIAGLNSYAQCGQPGWICMETGTFTACDGTTISDNGGGAAYTDGNFTLTLCPETPGDVIQLDFSAFALQNPPGNNGDDFLAIFDGDDISAPSLGSYTGNALQGLQVTGTVNNTSGCLTLQFNDIGTANDTSPGFEASVTCTTPCDPPTVASAITSPLPEDPQVQSVGICANTSISFSGNGSFAAPGFTLAQYIWNFDDGTVDNTSGVNATHNFTEPGEYIVTLTVEDNNGCQSLNIIPLQVLVSTTPLFPGILSQETCYPEMVTLTAVLDSDPNDGGNDDGVLDVVSPTWTALPPQVVAGETYLADGAGFSYTTCLEFDFFEDGAVLENCEDLLSVFVNMEHSYMGDLGLFITCPDGTIVSLVEWGVNGGTGTFLGEALDDENTDPGIGYDYFWSPDATNGTWGENATGQGILPSGTYAAYGDLCDLEGCPLNGAWCFSVTDNIGADNGYIFAWGLNLNPALYPDVTTFTPIIGADADSSYWSGPGIIELSADADTAYVLPNAAGIYNYTYTVINNFGCQFDTTITVEWTEPLEVTAGPDQLYSCGAVQLEGGFVGMDAPSCGADAGIFNYCYDNNENFTWTFCPDDPGDGVTYMTFTFLAGDMEGFLEDFIVYDGDNTAAPVIEAWSNGDATGLSWTATNATGCLTISFSSDGSSSCGDGLQSEWTYEISCSGGGPVYTWEWSPIDFLDNPNIPGPNVNDITQNTIYTLVGYPVGHPTCFSSDDVLVSIDPLGDPGLDASITICSTDAPFSMLDELNGTPVSTGEWFDPNNNPLPDDTFDPAVNLPGVYTHSVAFGNCEAIAELTISMALPTQIEISDDTTVCEFSDVSFLLTNLNFGQDPFSYQWNYNGTPIGNSTTGGSFMPDMTGELCLNVTDACGYVATECMDVVVEPAVDVVFEADTLAQCWPLGFYLTSLVDPALYNSIYWSVGDSVVAQNTESLPLIFNEPGSYTIGLRVTNFLGCNYSATYDDYLISYNPPIAGFDPDPQPTDATQTEIFFSDESIGDIVEYQWLFGYPILGASTLSNPTFTFPLGVGNEYPVTLNVTDIHGCTDQVSGIVDINDIFQVYVPNTFTPNYDGINDVFFFEGADIDETRFFLKIFNRWGDVIFESTDINVPWTGDVHDGEHFAGDGIYNWIALVTSKSTGEKYELSGIVNIIR